MRMPLSLNEIRARARAFAKEWADVTSERAESQSFWNEFFNVFGVNRRRVAVFEQKATRFSSSVHGRIDVFWPGVVLAEHKRSDERSVGKESVSTCRSRWTSKHKQK